ncbi:hypothetical protein SELMODRAFT_428308 [Selaginella moellendorffii]|uniref:Uncharacterized protein n=1 Tax=Selaginella moellendorffii TaxID=88036 RepID=D8T2E7_SELML|nr:hypothetical protein SELMODRAFT_428308 [Selaginella moellendorffii]
MKEWGNVNLNFSQLSEDTFSTFTSCAELEGFKDLSTKLNAVEQRRQERLRELSNNKHYQMVMMMVVPSGREFFDYTKNSGTSTTDQDKRILETLESRLNSFLTGDSSRGFMLFVGSRVVFDGENTYTIRKSGTRESGFVLYGEWLSGTNDNGSQCILKLTSSGCGKSPVFSKDTFTDKHFGSSGEAAKATSSLEREARFAEFVISHKAELGILEAEDEALFTVALAGNDLLFPFVTRNATLCEKNEKRYNGQVRVMFRRKVPQNERVSWKAVELVPAKDLEAQAQKFEHLIIPRFAEQREFFDMDSSQSVLIKVILLRSGQVLVFIRDVLTSRLDIHLIGYFGARSTGPPKTFNRGADLLAFDKSLRLLALWNSSALSIKVFGLDESFRELTSNGVTIQLGGYRGSRGITWMEFVPGKEELLVTDVTRRVFQVVQPAMMKARVIQLPPSFLGPCLTSDGLCLLAVCGSPSEDGVALSAEVHRLGDSLEHMLGLALRDGNNFQLATYPAAGG